MHVINLLWTFNEEVQNKTEKLDTNKTIGRADGNTFQVLDPQISGKQAVIRSDGKAVVIENVSETNNIKVDNTVVNKAGGTAQLKDLSVILMGSTTFETRIISFDSDVNLDESCTTCSRPIPSGTTVCPWCGATQSGTEGITMATS